MQKRYYYLLATNTWKEEISLIILEDWREGKETIVLVIFKTKNKFWVCIVIPSKKICSENKWGNKIKLFCWLFVYCMLTFERHNIQAATYTQRSYVFEIQWACQSLNNPMQNTLRTNRNQTECDKTEKLW